MESMFIRSLLTIRELTIRECCRLSHLSKVAVQHLGQVLCLHLILGLSRPAFPLLLSIAISVFGLIMEQDLRGRIRQIYAVFAEPSLNGPNH
jgi:hypothetical protein